MADTGIQFDFKPLQQYSERLERLDKLARQLDKTLDRLQAKQNILDRRFSEGSQATQRIINAFNQYDRAAIAALRNSEKLEEVFADSPDSVRRFEDSLKKTKQALDDVKSAAEQVDPQAVVDNFEKAGSQAGSGFGRKLKEAFDRLPIAQSARSIGNKLGEGLVRLLPDVVRRSGDLLIRGFKTIAQQVSRSFIGGLRSLGNAAVNIMQGVRNRIAGIFQGIGRVLAIGGLAGGLSFGALAGGAFQTAIEFDRALVNTQAVTQQTNEEIALLREQLLEIGGDSRVGVEATAAAFYDVSSAIQDVNLRIPILESSVLLSEAGADPVRDLATATNGLINVFNAYNLTAEDAIRVSDTFARSVQLGKGSLDEFVNAISDVAVVGANANVSFEELGASVAFLTARGVSAAEAATQLRQAVVSLLRPNAELQVLLHQIGFESGSAALESLGLAGTLQALYEATGGNIDQFARALGSVEALQAGLALADESFNDFRQTFDQGLEGATLRSAEIQAQSVAAQFDELRAIFGRVQVILADALLPVILPAVRDLTDLLANIAENNPELIRFAAILGTVAIALPIIGAALSLILNPVTLLIAGIGLLTAAFLDFIQAVPALQDVARLVSDVGSALGIGGAGPEIPETPGTPPNTPAALQQEQRLLALSQRRFTVETDIARTREDSARRSLDYTVEAGDTLSQIAVDYGVSIEEILDANPEITDPNLIITGQTIRIPGEADVEVELDRSGLQTQVIDEVQQFQDEITALGVTAQQRIDLGLSIDSEVRAIRVRNVIDDLRTSLGEIITTARQGVGQGFTDLVDGFQLISEGNVYAGLGKVKDAFTGIVSTLSNAAFGTLDTFLLTIEDLTGIDTGGLRTTLDNVRDILDGVFEAIGNFTQPIFAGGLQTLKNDIGPALDVFGAGFNTFLGQVADIVQGESFQKIASFLGQIIGLIVNFVGQVGGSVISSVGENLPLLGEGIGNIVDAVALFIEGDTEGGLEALGSGVSNIYNSLVGFTADAADGILQAIENITGIDLSGLRRVLRDIELILRNPLAAIQDLLQDIATFIEFLALNLELKLLQAVRNVPGVELIPGINLEAIDLRIGQLQTNLNEINAVGNVEAEIARQLQEFGVLDIENFNPLIRVALTNPDIVARLGPLTQARIVQAIQDSLISGTPEEIFANLEFAQTIGLDLSDVDFTIPESRRAELSAQVTEDIESILATDPGEFGAQDAIRLSRLIEISGDLDLDINLAELGLPTLDTLFNLDEQFGALGQIGSGIVSGISAGISESVAAQDAANQLIEDTVFLLDVQSNIPNEVGADIVSGLAAGITENITTARDAATNLAEDTINVTKDVVGAQSPATAFKTIGEAIAEGLALGITQGFPKVKAITALLRSEIRMLGLEGSQNLDRLTHAFGRFAQAVQAVSGKVVSALLAISQALIAFGSAAAGLALSVSITENALVAKQAGGLIAAFAGGGLVQTLSAPGMSEHGLYRAGSVLQAMDTSAVYALAGERGVELVSPDLSVFGMNRRPSLAYKFGFNQATNPTVPVSFVGGGGPELIRTKQSLAILDHQTTKAYLRGYQDALRGHQAGGVVYADIPRFQTGGFLSSPAALAGFASSGTIINEDNSINVSVLVEGGATLDADELADTIIERVSEERRLQEVRKSRRSRRQL